MVRRSSTADVCREIETVYADTALCHSGRPSLVVPVAVSRASVFISVVQIPKSCTGLVGDGYLLARHLDHGTMALMCMLHGVHPASSPLAA